MKYTAFVALLFVASIPATAQEQKPVVVQQRVKVQLTKPIAVQLDSGTEKAPLVVSGTIHEENTPDKQAAEAAKEKDEHELTVATDRLATWTVRLGIASFVTAGLTLWTILLTRKSAQALPKIERAYLFVTVSKGGIHDSEDEKSTEIAAKIEFKNHGRTPAILKSLRHYHVRGIEAPNELIEHARANRELPQGLVVSIDKPYVRTERIPLSKEQFAELHDGAHHVYVVGSMKYEDVIGDAHEVSFCWMSQTQKRNGGLQFTICPSKLNRVT